jgi:hypothetical protein
VEAKGNGNCGIEAVLVGRLSQQKHRPRAATSGDFADDLQEQVKEARHMMAHNLRARMGYLEVPDPHAPTSATEKHMWHFESDAAQMKLSPEQYATYLGKDRFYIDASGVQEMAIDFNTSVVILSYLGNSRWTYSVFIPSGEYPAELSLAFMVARPEQFVFLVRTHSSQDATDRSAHFNLLIPRDQFNEVLHTTTGPVRPARSVLQSIRDQFDEEVIPHSFDACYSCRHLNICFNFRLNHAHISIATAATSSRAAATSSRAAATSSRGGGGGQENQGCSKEKGYRTVLCGDGGRRRTGTPPHTHTISFSLSLSLSRSLVLSLSLCRSFSLVQVLSFFLSFFLSLSFL